jgi:hypothetical protein
MSSGSVPDMHAAVSCSSAAEQPHVTSAHSACMSSLMRWPAANCSSSICTYCCEALAIASRTSGSISEPEMMVYVPLQLISGRSPRDSYVGPPGGERCGVPPARVGSRSNHFCMFAVSFATVSICRLIAVLISASTSASTSAIAQQIGRCVRTRSR